MNRLSALEILIRKKHMVEIIDYIFQQIVYACNNEKRYIEIDIDKINDVDLIIDYMKELNYIVDDNIKDDKLVIRW